MLSPRDLTWPRRTERLTLRMVADGDNAALYRIRRQPAVAEWMTARPATPEQFDAIMAEPFRRDATIIVEREGRVIGDLMIRVEDPWGQSEVKDRTVGRQAEIGWCLAPEFQGQGYAHEGVVELLRICFTELGLHRVVATCFTDNTPSWRLMEKVGMRREAHHRKDSLHRDRGWCDGFVYALLAEEYAGARDTVGT